VIHESEEPWWNDIDRRKLLILPPELSENSTSSHVVAKLEGHGKEIAEFFADFSYLFLTRSDL
jgi:hypothetical protein